MLEHENIVEIKINSEQNFFFNKKTGKWIFAKSLNEKYLGLLLEDLGEK